MTRDYGRRRIQDIKVMPIKPEEIIKVVGPYLILWPPQGPQYGDPRPSCTPINSPGPPLQLWEVTLLYGPGPPSKGLGHIGKHWDLAFLFVPWTP
ncbi:hypothetical protein O181_016720 [Austropuccinia psidii MF-1]|uniref:Uncharacterized protein n=1 Tax=Austropuccinia psidii MF-1 TaxID=1389203 RepID=A0A9Q3C5F2_9BASI|nr:hypothetical protein [Austropuccinia psidii MF-1]